MADNQRSWWQQWTDTTYIKPLNRLVGGPCLTVLSPILSQDAWDMQEFITRMYVKQLLRHPASKVLLAVLLVVNAITIALRTNSMLGQKHYELFSTIDDIVLTTLICELLLGWLNGFWIFWKDGWNILNFLIIFILLLGFFVNELSAVAITYTLRALCLLHVCMAVEPLARIIRVILQSVPDMANIMVLILFFMLVFSVFGVTLFGVFVPMHFQNMQVALYTLFICITQDGWVDIYSDFQFAIGINSGGIFFPIYFPSDFSITNLTILPSPFSLPQVDDRKGNGNNKLPLVHCAVARSEMSGVPQEPFMGGSLTNLSERTCDNFCLVLEAIQENLMQYKEIRAELNTIVDEVRSIRFNQEQEEELMQRYLSWNMSLESRSSVDIREMTREQDLITALVNRKKVQESNTNVNKRKASR
uniref:Ion transport domain-containing protein n=1 Tax=Capra hircus TaxID=9925 RepID=A0A8C2N9L0_CAPHI